MIRVTALYPQKDGGTFDHDYYQTNHVPMVKEKLGPALKRISVEKGLGTAEPGQPAPFVASGIMEFESVDAFSEAFGPQAEQIMGDMPNYTNIEPVVQIAEIVE